MLGDIEGSKVENSVASPSSLMPKESKCNYRELLSLCVREMLETEEFLPMLSQVCVCPALSITRSYYRNSVGGLLVFDITSRRSFEHVKDWLEEAKMHVQPFQIVFLLVGHKCDLVSQREVTREEAEKLSADCGMKYIETSAKDATNVEESFTILTRDIYELVKKGEISIQDGWEGVKSGFVPNVVHSSEEAVKPRRQCTC
ncbi:PREDICTED: ras-related protein Rab-39A [Chaetura pelagica]|uniref:ras-related protein Rab-39A n=1 Tax=Chaetura pelagica TaxID=8897 RepID=UPI00052355B5|nr:PREDICTED: ras-related protein Rab-39A [Chaetura pelagica]